MLWRPKISLIKYARDQGAGDANWNPALHPRTGTSPNPGWFAPTDGASDRSTPTRAAQNDAAGHAADTVPSSSKPGDPFPTAQAAAIAALLSVYAISRSTHLEYSGRIYRNADGTFSYTQGLTDSQRYPDIPNRNCCPSNSSPGNVPEGKLDMGTYHTHPIDRHAEFSMLDKSFYTYRDKLPGYLVGSNDQGVGEILQFTPGETVYQGITQSIDTISGGRFIPNPKFNPNEKPRIPPSEGDSYDPNKPDPENE